MLTGLAHSAVCVPDVEAAVAWYRDVLGMRVLSPPYEMAGDAIERDMGELLPSPVVVRAAIVGVADDDRVLEVVEYPAAPPDERRARRASIAEPGLSHVGLVCDDLAATRAALEAQGAAFLTTGDADVAGLRTAWFRDPWGVVFILMEKGRPERPYWRQYGS
jgi:catechol 2,3-dioxygenase-like lactoylglutathione lyase family enzyme